MLKCKHGASGRTPMRLARAYMNDDCLSRGAHIHLCGSRDVEVPEVGLELRVGGFQVEEGLRHRIRLRQGGGWRLH